MILIAFNTGLLPNLPEPYPSPESLRIFHIILSYPLAREYPACLSIIVTFVKVFLYISDKARETIGKQWLLFEFMWDYFIREGGGRIILLGRGGEVVAILMCLRFNNNEMELSVGFVSGFVFYLVLIMCLIVYYLIL